ncbi:hypothetical protein Q0S69_22010 [Escherichia coli :H15]
MKLFIFSLFVIVTSMVSGIAIAELSYFILLIIKYLAYGEVDFRWSEVLRGLRMGGRWNYRFWYSLVSLSWHKRILSEDKGRFVVENNALSSHCRCCPFSGLTSGY